MALSLPKPLMKLQRRNARTKLKPLDVQKTWQAMQDKAIPHLVSTSAITILGTPVLVVAREALPTQVPMVPWATLPWLAAMFCFTKDLLHEMRRNNESAKNARDENFSGARINSHKFYAATAFLAIQIIGTLCVTRGQITPYQSDVDYAIHDHLKVLSETRQTLDDVMANPGRYGKAEIILPLAKMNGKLMTPTSKDVLNDGVQLRDPISLYPGSNNSIRDAYMRLHVAGGLYWQTARDPALRAEAASISEYGKKMIDDPRFTRIKSTHQP